MSVWCFDHLDEPAATHNVDPLFLQNLDGGVRVVKTEYEHAFVLARNGEAVGVFHVDARALERVEDGGQAAGTVGHFEARPPS